MPIPHPALSTAETLAGRWPGEEPSESPTLVPGSPEPTLHLEPGIVLNGRYRVEDFVGRGGMGEVFRVVDALTPSSGKAGPGETGKSDRDSGGTLAPTAPV